MENKDGRNESNAQTFSCIFIVMGESDVLLRFRKVFSSVKYQFGEKSKSTFAHRRNCI